MSYDLSGYDIALIGGWGTIVGTLVGAWINYRFWLHLSTFTDKRAANQRLISTFHRELSGLYPYPINWPENIDDFLRSKFNILNAAVGAFRHYLPEKDWESFDKAWSSFYGHTGREIDIKNCQCYFNYMAFGDNQNYKEKFKYDVGTLLKFAKHA